MDHITIKESVTLPSKGKFYKDLKTCDIQLRSMTTEEEMLRVSATNTPYKQLCEIIDRCITNDIGMSSYDMHIGDYLYLLYKLRVVTYGSEYLNQTICPFCGQVNVSKLDLDNLQVLEMTDDIASLIELQLPSGDHFVTLKYKTPRECDLIDKEIEEFKHRNPNTDVNIDFLIDLRHGIKLVDGQHYDALKLDAFLKKLPMKDTNAILNALDKINLEVGVNNTLVEKCKNSRCGLDYTTSFRFTSEFFRPKAI